MNTHSEIAFRAALFALGPLFFGVHAFVELWVELMICELPLNDLKRFHAKRIRLSALYQPGLRVNV